MAAKKNNKGQAIFEFLIFLPFVLIFLNVFVTIQAAINGSINQKKATRGYFFRLVKGNPYLPMRDDANAAFEAVNNVSAFMIGWREKEKSDQSFLPCYGIVSFLSGKIEEKCDDSISDPNAPTYLIKVGTMFGVCGADIAKESLLYDHVSAGSGTCGLSN